MTTKVKIFVRDIRMGKLEEEVNEFLIGKKVMNVQFSYGAGFAIMVVYDG